MNTDIAEKTPCRKYYIVDFNSVKADGFDGLEKLTADDNVIIFFGKSNDNVNFSVLSKLYTCKAGITMKEIENDKLMSLVIAVYIGSIINENSEIYLICKDGSNYKKSVELALGEEVNITLRQNIAGILPLAPPKKKKVTPKPEEKILSDEMEQAIETFNLSREDKIFILDTLNLHNSREIISMTLYKYFGTSSIYIAIKPYI